MKNMKKRKTLLTHIVLPIIVLSLLGSCIISILLWTETKYTLTKIGTADLLRKMNIMNSTLAEEQASLQLQINYLATNINMLMNSLSNQTIAANYFNKFVESAELENLFFLNNSGTILYSYKPHPLTQESEKKAITAAQTSVGTSVITATDSAILLTISKKIEFNQTSYIILLQKSISGEDFLVNHATGLDVELTLFINDVRVGTTIKNANGQYITGMKLDNSKVFEQVYTKKENYIGTNQINGQTYLTMYAPFPTDDPSVKTMCFVGTNFESVTTNALDIMKTALPTIIGMLLLIVIVVVIIIKQTVIKPITQTMTAFQNLNGESGQADLAQRIAIRREDEIGIMCTAVNKFIGTQNSLLKKVKQVSDSLKQAGETLAASSQQSASATAQIMANISSVKNSVEKQSNALSNVLQIVDKNISDINNLDKLIENQSAGIVESSASIEEMAGNISSVSNSATKMAAEYHELIELTRQEKQRQDEVAQQVSNMAQQSQHLAEANSVIAQIASQTNLLAMNAAIEAAHAGEAGKGFSVVADEIRKLAVNSSAQSKAIKAELSSISEVIASVVEATEASQEDFARITDKVTSTERLVQEIDHAMVEQKEASQQVLTALHDINDAASEVQTTSKDMADAVVKTKETSNNLETIARSVEGSMDEMSEGAKEISTSAQHVSDMAYTTKENIKTLEDLLSKFKLAADD